MTGALAAAAAIWRTAVVHPTPHHTLISLSARRSASSLLGSTTPRDAFDIGRLGQSHIRLAELQSKAFFSRLWFWLPC